MSRRKIEINPVSGSLGAELAGIDLSKPLSEETFEKIRGALWRFGVIFFRDQRLSREAQLEFARGFGEPDIHPIAEGMEDYPEVIRVFKDPKDPSVP